MNGRKGPHDDLLIVGGCRRGVVASLAMVLSTGAGRQAPPHEEALGAMELSSTSRWRTEIFERRLPHESTYRMRGDRACTWRCRPGVVASLTSALCALRINTQPS